jgi:hypothetical protein
MATPASTHANDLSKNPLAALLAGDEPLTFALPSPSDPKVTKENSIGGLGLVDSKDDFHNSAEPQRCLKQEKPEHRIIIFLKARGHSNVEIAEATGFHKVTVGNVLRQPWAKERLLHEINKTGRDAVQTMIQSAALDSVLKLIEVRDDPETPKAVASANCERLLDRYLGKPKQQVDVQHSGSLEGKDLQQLDKEIEALQTEQNRLQGIYAA